MTIQNSFTDNNGDSRTTAKTSPSLHNTSLSEPGSAALLADESYTTASPIVCRICYSTCGTLYAFCKCKGSVGYVHKECLKRWIDSKLKANKCEICQSPFFGTEWSFKPVSKWATPKMSVLDKLYLALFICCSIIVLYSVPWISYKSWQSRRALFGDGPITSERIFALIVIAIYIPLNISCIASLVVLWRRAVAGICHRFIEINKMWRVRITTEVAESKLINAINSTCKSVIDDNSKLANDDSSLLTKKANKKRLPSLATPEVDDTFSPSQHGDSSGDSSAMLISISSRKTPVRERDPRLSCSNTTLRSYNEAGAEV